jgi:hypothetical protein
MRGGGGGNQSQGMINKPMNAYKGPPLLTTVSTPVGPPATMKKVTRTNWPQVILCCSPLLSAETSPPSSERSPWRTGRIGKRNPAERSAFSAPLLSSGECNHDGLMMRSEP